MNLKNCFLNTIIRSILVLSAGLLRERNDDIIDSGNLVHYGKIIMNTDTELTSEPEANTSSNTLYNWACVITLAVMGVGALLYNYF